MCTSENLKIPFFYYTILTLRIIIQYSQQFILICNGDITPYFIKNPLRNEYFVENAITLPSIPCSFGLRAGTARLQFWLLNLSRFGQWWNTTVHSFRTCITHFIILMKLWWNIYEKQFSPPYALVKVSGIAVKCQCLIDIDVKKLIRKSLCIYE